MSKPYCHKCGEDVPAIHTDSDEWCDLMDEIQKYVNMTKEDLILMLHEPGESETKSGLRSCSKGELVVKLIEEIHGV